MPTYNSCTRCGGGVNTSASHLIGLCNGCRIYQGWTFCSKCGNDTIPPNGDPCPMCVASAAPATPTATVTTPTTYTTCTQCATPLTTPLSKRVGVCPGCRVSNGWSNCMACGCHTISPSAAPCPVCASVAAVAVPVPTSPTPGWYTRCTGCRITLGTHKAEQRTGLCISCRNKAKWGGCPKCSNYTIAPGTTADSCMVCYPTATPKVASAPPPAVDLGDWKVWRDHGLQPGECVCRIPRDKCDYHR